MIITDLKGKNLQVNNYLIIFNEIDVPFPQLSLFPLGRVTFYHRDCISCDQCLAGTELNQNVTTDCKLQKSNDNQSSHFGLFKEIISRSH